MSLKNRMGLCGCAALTAAALMLTAGSCDVRDTQVAESLGRVEETSGLFRFIPDDQYISLGFTDIDSILGNDWVQQFIDLSPEIKLWDEKLGIGIEEFHKFAIALLPPKEDEIHPSALIIMSSDLPEKTILGLLGEKSTYFKKLKVGARTQYIIGKNFSFGFLDESVVALGTPKMVSKAIELAEGKGLSLLDGKNLKGFNRYLGSSDDFWFGLGNLNRMIESIAIQAPIAKNFSKIDFIYLGFKATEGLESRVIMDCTSEKDAGKIARGLSSMIGLMSTLMDFEGSFTVPEDELTGLSLEELKSLLEDFLNNIEIDSRGSQVHINVVMPKEMIDFLLTAARKAMIRRQDQLPDDVDQDGFLENY